MCQSLARPRLLSSTRISSQRRPDAINCSACMRRNPAWRGTIRPGRTRMTFDRLWLRVVVVVAIGTVPTLSRAGGVGFGEDDANNSDDGPSYFGFVREVDGPGVADGKVTAALKDL